MLRSRGADRRVMPMLRAGRTALVLFVLFVCALVPRAMHTQPGRVSDYQVKAAFLFNFAQFVTWPPEAAASDTSAFVIGVLGDDPFGVVLEETVRGEHLGSRPYVIHRFQRPEDVKRCDILFISQSERSHFPEILTTLAHRPLLTVSDADGFVEGGGMIRFATEQNHVRLKINLGAAQAAHLTVSSKLLRLADVVVPGGR